MLYDPRYLRTNLFNSSFMSICLHKSGVLEGDSAALSISVPRYLDFVTIAAVPEDYDERLIEMFPGIFKHLQLFALDPYDLAPVKLECNVQRDRNDVKHLTHAVPFDLSLLRERYERELRPYLGNPVREDLTLWL